MVVVNVGLCRRLEEPRLPDEEDDDDVGDDEYELDPATRVPMCGRQTKKKNLREEKMVGSQWGLDMNRPTSTTRSIGMQWFLLHLPM